MSDKPLKHGKKWSDEEKEKLLDEIKNNIDIDEIAKLHERTTGGINSRLNDIAFCMHMDGHSIESIYEKTKVNQEKLNVLIEKRKTYMENKKETVKKHITKIEPSEICI